MTRKFKKAVKSYVRDGVLTPEEKANLHEMGKLEEESELELEIYITKELKRRKAKIAKGPNWFEKNGAAIITGAVTLGGVVLKHFLDGKGKGK
jgi:hypothetical protein